MPNTSEQILGLIERGRESGLTDEAIRDYLVRRGLARPKKVRPTFKSEQARLRAGAAEPTGVIDPANIGGSVMERGSVGAVEGMSFLTKLGTRTAPVGRVLFDQAFPEQEIEDLAVSSEESFQQRQEAIPRDVGPYPGVGTARRWLRRGGALGVSVALDPLNALPVVGFSGAITRGVGRALPAVGRRLAASGGTVSKMAGRAAHRRAGQAVADAHGELAERGKLADFFTYVRSGVSHWFSPDGAFPLLARQFKDPEAKQFFKEFLPRALDEMKGQKKVWINRAGELHRQVAREIKQTSKMTGIPVEDLGIAVNEARRSGSLEALPPMLAREDGAVRRAFGFIDDLSERFIDEGLLQPEMVETFKTNMGRYLHVSHKKFDIGDWARRVEGTSEWSAMDEYLKATQPELDAAQRTALMYDIADENPRGLGILTGVAGKQSLRELKRSKQIDPVVRDFMGLRKDFLFNFDKSAQLMIHDLEMTRFFRQVAEEGLARGVFRRAAGEGPSGGRFFKELPLSKIDDPVFATKDVHDVFHLMRHPENRGPIVGGLMYLSGITKLGKVVFSPQTQIRNFESGLLMSMANGFLHHPVMFPKEFGRSVAANYRTILGSMDELKRGGPALRKTVEEGLRHNILKSGANAGEIEDYMRQAGAFGHTFKESKLGQKLSEVSRGLPRVPGADRARKATVALRDAFISTYHAGDDIWKLAGYNTRKGELRWALGLKGSDDIARSADGKAFQEIFGETDVQVAAADYVKSSMQHYDNAPRLARALGRNPLTSPFVTFQFEMPRNLKNIMVTAAKEAQMFARTKNPRWLALSMSRVAGMAEATVLVHQAASWANKKSGFSDRMMRGFRRTFARDYNANSDLVVIEQDGPEITYLDGGFSDPYSQVKKPIVGFLSSDRAWTDPERWKVVLEELDDTYLGSELLFSAVMEQIFNRRVDSGLVDAVVTAKAGRGREIVNPEDPAGRRLGRRAFAAHRRLSPGGVVTGERIARAAGLLDNRKMNLDLLNELVALGGPRLVKVNVDQELTFRLRRSFTERRRDLSTGHGNRIKDGDDPVIAGQFSERRWQQIWDSSRQHVEDALEMGRPRPEVLKSIRGAGIRQDLAEALVAGRYVPFAKASEPIKKPRSRRTF